MNGLDIADPQSIEAQEQPAEKPRLNLWGFLNFVGWLWIVAGLGAFLFSSLAAWRQYETLSSWTHTDAEVIASEMYSKDVWIVGRGFGLSGHWSKVYGFRCSLALSANNQQILSQSDAGIATSFANELKEWPNRLPPGSHVLVAYDPSDPTHVRIAGNSEIAYGQALLGFRRERWLLLAGTLLISITWRTRGNFWNQRELNAHRRSGNATTG